MRAAFATYICPTGTWQAVTQLPRHSQEPCAGVPTLPCRALLSACCVPNPGATANLLHFSKRPWSGAITHGMTQPLLPKAGSHQGGCEEAARWLPVTVERNPACGVGWGPQALTQLSQPQRLTGASLQASYILKTLKRKEILFKPRSTSSVFISGWDFSSH